MYVCMYVYITRCSALNTCFNLDGHCLDRFMIVTQLLMEEPTSFSFKVIYTFQYVGNVEDLKIGEKFTHLSINVFWFMAWARIVENFRECAKKTLQSTVIRLVLFWGLCYVHHLQIAFCFMSCIDCCIHSTFANSNSWAPETLPIQFNAEPAEPKGVDLTEQHVDWMNRKGDLNNKPWQQSLANIEHQLIAATWLCQNQRAQTLVMVADLGIFVFWHVGLSVFNNKQ